MFPEIMRVYVTVLLLASCFQGVLAEFEEVLPQNPIAHSTQSPLQGGFGQELRLDGSCQGLGSI